MTNNTQKENAITEEALLLARYRRAETLEHEVCDQSMVLNAEVFPHWIDGSNCFWYIKTVRDEANGTAGKAREYRLVNAEAASNTLAFDHQLMASLLAQASGQEVNPNDLPISELTLELSPLRATFTAFGQCWQFDAAAERCEEITVHDDPNAGAGLLSPDGKKVAFTRDYNLWVRDVESGEESAMTFDGERYYAYAVQPESRNLTEGLPGTVSWFPVSLEALWSPDSSKLFTLQTDERQVRSVPSMLYVPQDGSSSA